MPFLDRFRRRADPDPVPEPDDPRVSALAAEIALARGNTYDWLLWSGGLLGDGDAANEATALVRKRWWHFDGEPRLIEIDEELAADVLSWLIGHTLAYDSELMTSERATTFAATFMSLVARDGGSITAGTKGHPQVDRAPSAMSRRRSSPST